MKNLIQMSRARYLVAAGLGAGAGLLIASVVLGQSPGSPDEDKEKRVQAAITATAAAGYTPNPTEIARQDAENQAKMTGARAGRAEWLERFNASGVDPRDLELSEIGAEYIHGPAVLEEATEQAQLIVSGIVTRVEFSPPSSEGPITVGSIHVQFEIDQVVKGDADLAGHEILVAFGGGPVPRWPATNASTNISPDTAALAYFTATPPILTGDRAVLLLLALPSEQFPERFTPAGWVGVNKIIAGRIQATTDESAAEQLNLLFDIFHDKTEQDFTQLLRQAIERNSE